MKNKLLIIIFSILFASILSFLIGIHWHGTVSQWIQNKKIKAHSLRCYGHNNLTETYQQDCYAELNRPAFVMKDHLICQYITIHQLETDMKNKMVNEQNIKSDYRKLTIDIDSKKKILTRSADAGEVVKGTFTIIKEDTNTLLAERKTVIDDVFYKFTNYEYILLTKKSGTGTITYTDVDASTKTSHSNINTAFFQCQ